MNLFRRHCHNRLVAFFAALLLLSTVAVAGLAPHFKRVDISEFQVLCTASGMKLVKGDGSAQGHTLDCPSCLGVLATPPALHESAALELPNFSIPSAPALHFGAREALAALARGPPQPA